MVSVPRDRIPPARLPHRVLLADRDTSIVEVLPITRAASSFSGSIASLGKPGDSGTTGRGLSQFRTPAGSDANGTVPFGKAGHGRGAGGYGSGKFDALPSAAAANPLPPYPPEALARGTEGTVLLRVSISRDGTVLAATLVSSSGDRTLDDSALSTVRHWQFEPARLNGMAVPCEVNLPIRYHVNAGQ
jgi:periplasmic protein TonB